MSTKLQSTPTHAQDFDKEFEPWFKTALGKQCIAATEEDPVEAEPASHRKQVARTAKILALTPVVVRHLSIAAGHDIDTFHNVDDALLVADHLHRASNAIWDLFAEEAGVKSPTEETRSVMVDLFYAQAARVRKAQGTSSGKQR